MFGIGDKILAYIGGGAALALALALTYVTVTKNVEISTLHDSIDNPSTGYKVQLATAQSNAISLKGGLDQCNAGTKKLADEKAATDARLSQALLDLAPLIDKLHKSAADVLAMKPGPDLCKSADELILGHVQ